jgi:hypothetical protein
MQPHILHQLCRLYDQMLYLQEGPGRDHEQCLKKDAENERKLRIAEGKDNERVLIK